MSRAAELATELDCDYVKLWPGQDGVDYPFQADHAQLWNYSVEAVRELATNFPDMKFCIEYKPREPRNRMVFSSCARTLLAIEEMGCDNVGILLDFGHSLYGGESPAEAAKLALSRDRLFAIDVNDNFRGWDDDMVVGSVHLHGDLRVLPRPAHRRLGGRLAARPVPVPRGLGAGGQGRDRDDARLPPGAAYGSTTMRCARPRTRQDALLAQRIAKKALYTAMAELDE